MAIQVNGLVPGGLVGLADLWLERQGGRIGPVAVTPMVGRALILGAGLAMQAFNFQANIGRGVATAAIPLLVKSAAEFVGLGRPLATRAARTVGRYPSPVQYPQFQGNRLV